MTINLNSVCEFRYGFGMYFILKNCDDDKYYLWLDPEYSGDNTIKPYVGNPKNHVSKGFGGRNKGIHKVIDYCGKDVKFISVEE
jgi:hypothetical protein